MTKFIPVEIHPQTLGGGQMDTRYRKAEFGKFFSLPYIWSRILFQRYCLTLVDLDLNQELGTEAYAFFRWMNGNLQITMRQQTGLSDEALYYELQAMTCSSLLERN